MSETTDWEIAGNALKENGTGGALAIHRTPHPAGSATCAVSAKIVDINAGDRFRVIVHYADSSNYCYAEYYYDGTDAWLSVSDVAGGAVTAIDSIPLDPPVAPDDNMHVCCNIGGIEAWMSS